MAYVFVSLYQKKGGVRRFIPAMLVVTLATSLMAPGQSIRREYWLGIPGTSVSALTSSPDFPHRPSGVTFPTLFEGPVNWADNYGTRMRGYVHPPLTGNYTFWIASDDNSQLFLSTDENPAMKRQIAYVGSWTSSRQWNKESNQKSQPVYLVAGQRYYIEALQKEGGGGDNIAVAWEMPNGAFEGPIPGSRLSPFQVLNTPPEISAQPEDVVLEEGARAEFRVSATGAEPLHFQWQRNGVNIELGTDPILVIDAVLLADDGARFQCAISNSLGSIFSREALLQVHPETNPPVVIHLNPPPGATVRRLSQLEVTFDEPVLNLEAADLLLNGQPAAGVTGMGAGPYLFEFAEPAAGPVEAGWAPEHGITDLTVPPNAFEGGNWSYILDPGAAMADLVINEFLASNRDGLKDEDGAAEDWIEIYNRGSASANLGGWALTDSGNQPGQWVFPEMTIGAGEYLVVFASGKDRRETGPGTRLHTNFKLSRSGEYLGLYSAESPRAAVDELAFPEQRTDFSYGRDASGEWRYFETPTPGGPNGASSIAGMVEPPHFTVSRGFFNTPFNLLLTVETQGAHIRYTTDGSEPSATTGTVYSEPLRITQTTILRAAAFQSGHLPSAVVTHTYFMGASPAIRSLPVLSLVTDHQNLFGPTGIMETNPRNTIHRGLAWERPVSVEYLRAEGGGFQIDCGLRIHGGNYVRERYNPQGSLPFNKYSFRLYFRGDYGATRLNHPLIERMPVSEFNRIVLRAGMNDHSNPFIVDELARRLSSNMGQIASHGTIVNLFINGVYRGYYNPTERIDAAFLRTWHASTNDWDLIAQFGEVQEGDTVEWNALRNAAGRDQSVPANYLATAGRMDMVNFIDYLLVNIYGGTGDWPHNNWRAARERVPGAKFQFIVWDAEWAFGWGGRSVNLNTFTGELARDDADIARFYRSLRNSPEFRLLFADRVQKHFYNNGALTDAGVNAEFTRLRSAMSSVLPNMNVSIGTTWIPNRRGIIMSHMAAEGLLSPVTPPAFNQHGGRVPSGFGLAMSAPSGTIYYTTDGTDPRVPFGGAVSGAALAYTGAALDLTEDLWIRARVRNGTQWSALVEAEFQVDRLGLPVRFTEIMYNPPGGRAYEFVELQNTSGHTVELGGIRVSGIGYMFPVGTVLQPGEVIVLASDDDPAAFAMRYPGVTVHGYFGGRLSNSGERLALVDRNGVILFSVTYSNDKGWPAPADGGGHSLEIIDVDGDPNDPANWRAGAQPGGSPGEVAPAAATPSVRLNELMAHNVAAINDGAGRYPDWVELFNAGNTFVSLENWSLTDSDDPRRYVFPAGIVLSPGEYLVVWCDRDTSGPGLRTGFALSRQGENLFLYDNQTNRVDGVSFGWQLTDYSIGRMGDAWGLTDPTPGAANAGATVAAPSALAINEWMANPLPGDSGWIELYNRDLERPAALRGLYLSNGAVLDQIGSLSFVPAGGYARFHADASSGPGHLSFKLPVGGSPIVLYDGTGHEVDRVTNPVQAAGASRGRFPDGDANQVNFPNTPSPGAPNYILDYSGPLLNEVMARNVSSAAVDSQGRRADWIELHNPLPSAFDLSGMSLSRERDEPGQWFFPQGVTIPGGGYLVVWFDSSRPASAASEPDLNMGRSLSRRGGGVYLFRPGGQMADFVTYGPQIADRTIGRSAAGSWRLLEYPTPGADNAVPAQLASPSRLRINEWMASSSEGDDWFEVYNIDSQAVDLSRMYLTDDPSISGRTNTQVVFLSFIAGHGFVEFRASGEGHRGAHHTNFRLDRAGESLRIYSSGLALIDAVEFGVQERDVSQGRLPDGGAGIVFLDWPTPGAPNAIPFGPPFITMPPESQVAGAGTNPSFTVAAAGQGTLEYQWYFEGEPIAGATNTSLWVPGADIEDQGDYHVVVTSEHGSVASPVATLTVNAPARFVLQPQSLTVLEGQTAVLTVQARGSLPIAYQWRRSGAAITNIVLNEYVSSFVLTDVQLSQAGEYRVVITNSVSSAGTWSDLAVLTVLADSDRDGMPDEWEIAHGLDPFDPSDAHDDWDGDGASNLEEYIAGTDPNDPESVFRVDTVRLEEGDVVIRFQAMAERSYTAQFRESLLQGDWERLEDIPSEPAPRWVEILDSGGGGAQRYYRLVTPRLSE